MFTGIIESLGRISRRDSAPGGLRLRVRPNPPFADLQLGESVAVNGVCLTAEPGSTPAELVFFLSSETVERTSLGEQVVGGRINLERALPAHGRLGGHLVQGHVDGVGRIARWEKRGEAWELTVAFPRELAPFIASKGSVAVDGISLTSNAVTADTFSVAVIPHTVALTNLADAAPGRAVNLEVDVLARYVVRALGVLRGGAVAGGDAAGGAEGTSGGISMEFLRQAGF